MNKNVVEFQVTPMSQERVGALAVKSILGFEQLDRSYHYGASRSNSTIPYDAEAAIEISIGKGKFSGVGKITQGFTEDCGLVERSFNAHSKNIETLITNLKEMGYGVYTPRQTIVLFSPIKFFVILSKGDEDTQVIYKYVNGHSNGTGVGEVVGRADRIRASEVCGSTPQERRAANQQRLASAHNNVLYWERRTKLPYGGTEKKILKGYYDSRMESYKERIARGWPHAGKKPSFKEIVEDHVKDANDGLIDSKRRLKVLSRSLNKIKEEHPIHGLFHA